MPGNQQQFEAMIAAFLGILCVAVVIALVILIFFLLTMQKALTRCSPRNRLMEPGMVWLMLIPCFNIIWQFFIAIRVPDSLKNEFQDRRRDDRSDYGKSLGLTYCILGLVNVVLSSMAQPFQRSAPGLAMGISMLSLLVSVVGLVLFIIFWVKIAGYSNQLDSDRDGRDWDRRGNDDDDYDDDRGPRRGGSRSEGFKEDDKGRFME